MIHSKVNKKTSFIRAVLLSTLFWIFYGCAGGGTEGSGGVDISGRIAESNGTPLANIMLTLLDENGIERASTASNADGQFNIPDIAFAQGSLIAEISADQKVRIPFEVPAGSDRVEISISKGTKGNSDSDVQYGQKKPKPSSSSSSKTSSDEKEKPEKPSQSSNSSKSSSSKSSQIEDEIENGGDSNSSSSSSKSEDFDHDSESSESSSKSSEKSSSSKSSSSRSSSSSSEDKSDDD